MIALFNFGAALVLVGLVAMLFTGMAGSLLAWPTYAGRAWIVFRVCALIVMVGVLLTLVSAFVRVAAQNL